MTQAITEKPIATHTLDNIIAHVSKKNPQRLVPSAPDARYRTKTIRLELPCVRDLLEQAYTVFLELPPNASLDHALKADRPYLHPHVKHLHNLARKAVLLTMAQETVATRPSTSTKWPAPQASTSNPHRQPSNHGHPTPQTPTGSSPAPPRPPLLVTDADEPRKPLSVDAQHPQRSAGTPSEARYG